MEKVQVKVWKTGIHVFLNILNSQPKEEASEHICKTSDLIPAAVLLQLLFLLQSFVPCVVVFCFFKFCGWSLHDHQSQYKKINENKKWSKLSFFCWVCLIQHDLKLINIYQPWVKTTYLVVLVAYSGMEVGFNLSPKRWWSASFMFAVELFPLWPWILLSDSSSKGEKYCTGVIGTLFDMLSRCSLNCRWEDVFKRGIFKIWFWKMRTFQLITAAFRVIWFFSLWVAGFIWVNLWSTSLVQSLSHHFYVI